MNRKFFQTLLIINLSSSFFLLSAYLHNNVLKSTVSCLIWVTMNYLTATLCIKLFRQYSKKTLATEPSILSFGGFMSIISFIINFIFSMTIFFHIKTDMPIVVHIILWVTSFSSMIVSICYWRLIIITNKNNTEDIINKLGIK
jgi:hypothetical protein